MDRYEEEKPTKPSKRYYSYASGEGKFKYYDKEKKENIYDDYPFRFIVLASYMTVTGFHEPSNSGIYSNEVQDNNFDTLTVHLGDEKIVGLWQDIDEKVKDKGGKYAQSVYVAMYDDNKEMYIANIKLSGAALGAWFDFTKANKVTKGGVEVKKNAKGKKGSVTYNLPVFKMITTTEETESKVKVQYDELKVYLKDYFAKNQKSKGAVDIFDLAPTKNELISQAIKEEEGSKPVEEDDLPF